MNKAKKETTCTCTKSNCQKNYCDCFKNGVLCSDNCRCLDCKNNKIIEIKSKPEKFSVEYVRVHIDNKNIKVMNGKHLFNKIFNSVTVSHPNNNNSNRNNNIGISSKEDDAGKSKDKNDDNFKNINELSSSNSSPNTSKSRDNNRVNIIYDNKEPITLKLINKEIDASNNISTKIEKNSIDIFGNNRNSSSYNKSNSIIISDIINTNSSKQLIKRDFPKDLFQDSLTCSIRLKSSIFKTNNNDSNSKTDIESSSKE